MKARRAQVSFTAGELSPLIKGRTDTAIYYLGCEALQNVLVRPEGSAAARPGIWHLRIVSDVTGQAEARLAAFSYNAAQRYIVVFTHEVVRVFDASTDALISTVASPYLYHELAALDYLQVGDTMLIVHSSHAGMQELARQSDGSFTIVEYEFERSPQYRYRGSGTTLTASATTGSVTLTANTSGTFSALDIGAIWTIKNKAVRITAVGSSISATATVLDTLTGTAATNVWTEQASSTKRGGFRSIAYYQGRLWFGGVRDAPTQIWASRVDAPYDFLVGGVTAADPFALSMSTGQIEPIRYIVPGSGGLEVYTAGGEGIIPGGIDAAITQGTVSHVPQSAFGSRIVKPVRLNSSTIFAQANSGNVREMIYSDTERAYNPVPLTVRAAHLVADPVRLAAVPGGFGTASDFLIVLNRDGSGAVMTSERSQEVTAWAQIVSARQLIDVCAVGSKVYVAARVGERVALQHMDTSARYDSQSSFALSSAATTFTGLSWLASSTVDVWADGYWLGPHVVSAGGVLTLATAALAVDVGLPFEVRIRPMPVNFEGESLLGRAVRPIRAEVRYYKSAGLRVNGRAIRDRDFDDVIVTPPQQLTATSRVQLLGWSKGETAPVEITREGPFPVEILALAVDYRIGGA